MNGFTIVAMVLSSVLIIILWIGGLLWTLDYVEDRFGYSVEKTVAISLVGYLGVTIAVLFGIGATV